MKVEIEIPDIEELAYVYDEDVSGKDVKKWIVDTAIYEFANNLYSEYMNNGNQQVETIIRDIVLRNSDQVVAAVIDRVSKEILRKKSIVSEMPKKSEVANISKEWEDYFVDLVDRALSRRFK